MTTEGIGPPPSPAPATEAEDGWDELRPLRVQDLRRGREALSGGAPTLLLGISSRVLDTAAGRLMTRLEELDDSPSSRQPGVDRKRASVLLRRITAWLLVVVAVSAVAVVSFKVIGWASTLVDFGWVASALLAATAAVISIVRYSQRLRFYRRVLDRGSRADLDAASAALRRASSGYPASKLSSGRRVRHPNFGIGTVLNVHSELTHTFVEVKFDDRDIGTKKLREDLAPLSPVEDKE